MDQSTDLQPLLPYYPAAPAPKPQSAESVSATAPQPSSAAAPAALPPLPEAADADLRWFAIKARQDFRAEEVLSALCAEVFFPTEEVKVPGRRRRRRAVIPRVLFVRTSAERLLAIERRAREHPELLPTFWIYRYPTDRRVQVISQRSIDLLRLLTADDTTRCEIFTKRDFKEGQHVRVTGGPFAGYEGFVQRVKKNRHVVVKIEGVCLVLLPFIHPDLLSPIGENE